MMSPALLSIKRPIFISCLVILMLALGFLSLKSLPIDLFPDVTLPTVVIATGYPGASPQEVETEITKILEYEMSSVSGISQIRSTNREGLSTIVAEFNLKVDVKYAEQQVRAKVQNALRQLPEDILQPVIRTLSPSDAPILFLAINANLPDGEFYDLVDDFIKPQFEQVNQVGQIEIVGGRKREIHVYLDRNKLRRSEISATQVAQALKQAGRNIPSGKTEKEGLERSYRTSAQFLDVQKIKETILRYADIDNPLTIGSVASVVDTLEDETSRTFINGKKALVLKIYRQSGANSVKVVDEIKNKLNKLNKVLLTKKGEPKIEVVNDLSRIIRANVDDVYESIFLGIVLTIFVVYLFLGSFRSTLITGLALPNSLLGAFILMDYYGFSINIMSLLALSLVVGLLIDDAIVVRENIYRKIEEGMKPFEAALEGTNEVTLAVVATTLTILAVFGPIGNLQGVVGQYFKQFGLTVCFAMLISLFDALTVAPMLSAYFAGSHTPKDSSEVSSKTDSKIFSKISSMKIYLKTLFSWLAKGNRSLLKNFDRFQTFLENIYEKTLGYSLKFPSLVLLAGVLLFVGSLQLARYVPVTFLPAQDNGEFYVKFELAPGANLDAMNKVADEIDNLIRKNPQVLQTLKTVGSSDGQSNQASLYVRLVPSKMRKENTSQFKDLVREQLLPFKYVKSSVSEADPSGQNQRAFNLNITGNNLDEVKAISEKILDQLKKNPSLKDVDTSYRDGKPEIHVKMNNEIGKMAGVTLTTLGQELRTQVEGLKTAVFQENGRDYDVRVRMSPEQRDLKDHFSNIFIPNINNQLIALSKIANFTEISGPASILRENRARYIQLSGDITPGGSGLGGVMKETANLIENEIKLPIGVSYAFVGQAERFAELITNILISLGLGLLFIYLVLASLYESFFTPFTIMLVIPLAACGAFAALFVTRTSLDLFSMIGCVMLMGLATKNSILLLDYTNHLMKEEKLDRLRAIIKSGKTRLRPILMTSFAMIAGMLPVAIGLNEASRQRVSLGIVVVGGTISSTFLTLFIIPAAFLYMDRFQNWFYKLFSRYVRGA